VGKKKTGQGGVVQVWLAVLRTGAQGAGLAQLGGGGRVEGVPAQMWKVRCASGSGKHWAPF
jgi:hypothetical protein